MYVHIWLTGYHPSSTAGCMCMKLFIEVRGIRRTIIDKITRNMSLCVCIEALCLMMPYNPSWMIVLSTCYLACRIVDWSIIELGSGISFSTFLFYLTSISVWLFFLSVLSLSHTITYSVTRHRSCTHQSGLALYSALHTKQTLRDQSRGIGLLQIMFCLNTAKLFHLMHHREKVCFSVEIQL
jgi:hypothetical protein